jgi:putative glutamine amidotransferase
MPPLILVSAHTENQSGEFPDAAISLSQRYADAIYAAGGLPVVLPPTADTPKVRQAIAQCRGLLLTGGDDVLPALHSPDLPPELRATVDPAVGGRDLFELILIDEAFRQGKPVLAICRGLQIANVALGGDLIADLPTQRPNAENHNQPLRRFDPVHDVLVEPGSLLARITGTSRFGVNSTHHQAASFVPPALRVTAWSEAGVVEALELAPDTGATVPFFLAVQFHPERLRDRHEPHARIFHAFVAACR